MHSTRITCDAIGCAVASTPTALVARVKVIKSKFPILLPSVREESFASIFEFSISSLEYAATLDRQMTLTTFWVQTTPSMWDAIR